MFNYSNTDNIECFHRFFSLILDGNEIISLIISSGVVAFTFLLFLSPAIISAIQGEAQSSNSTHLIIISVKCYIGVRFVV